MWAEQFARPLVVPFAFEMFCLSADRRATNSLSLKRTMARQPGHSIVTSIGLDRQKKTTLRGPVTHSKDFSACFDRVINVASLSLAFGSELPTGGDILPARERRRERGRGHHPSIPPIEDNTGSNNDFTLFPSSLSLSAFLLISSSRSDHAHVSDVKIRHVGKIDLWRAFTGAEKRRGDPIRGRESEGRGEISMVKCGES